MIWWWSRTARISVLLIAASISAASSASAQPLSLEYQQTVTRKIEGATAAFSLDPSRVAASARDGEVTLVGRGPGTTHVIVIVGNGSESFEVSVNQPPTIVLGGTGFTGASGSATTVYDVRYASDPDVLQGTFRSLRHEGNRTTELWLGGAAPFDDRQSAPFSVPLAGYTIRTPEREITLFDAVVANSPLTISRSNVRGLHLREGPWQLHAGYSFFASFEHLLLPTNGEAVAGIGYRYRLGPRSTVTPNFYSFAPGADLGRARSLGTVLYELTPRRDARIAAEVAVGRTAAGDFEVEVERPKGRFWSKVRFAPADLPALTTDQQAGRQIEGLWTRYGTRLSVNANVSSRAYGGSIDQTSSVAAIDLRYHLPHGWSLHGGPGYSSFDTSLRRDLATERITVPVGAQFARRAIGFDADYQFSRETGRDLAGHLFRGGVNGTAGAFRFSAYGERQTQAPTVGHIFASAPWLQQLLDRLGLTANTPEQLAELLRVNAEISAYGYANDLTIHLTPVRERIGASAGWSGSGPMRPQLFVSTLINRDESIDRTSRGAVHTLTYSQRLGSATELFSNWSLLCTDYSQPHACHPTFAVSLRQSFGSAPRLLLPGHEGEIGGIVFRDEQAAGVYSSGLPTLAGVDVLLDGSRRARTDAHGRFRFEGVPYGRHRVEVQLPAGESFFFTTPSPADVETDRNVDFGVATRTSGLRAEVHSDTGAPLSGVVVRIVGPDRQFTAETTDNGGLVARGLSPGTYVVALDAGSLPPGYALDRIAPQQVKVSATEMGKAAFVLRPYRSIAGQVRVFDRRTGAYAPLPRAVVELRDLHQTSVTDASGRFMFRDLPSGDHVIVASQNEREHAVTISVPEGPALVKEVNVVITSDAGPRSAVPVASAPAPATAGAVSDEPFVIQVAAFRNAQRARALVAALQRSGFPAYLVEPIATEPNPLYRVRLGRYVSRAEVDDLAAVFESVRGEKVWVLRASRPR